MIDSHIHTKYSKHATGSVREVVESAIKIGVKTLSITDHAPFLIDVDNRLLDIEIQDYCHDVISAKKEYRNDIKILLGMEFDFTVDSLDYLKNLMAGLQLDYSIGSIHYIDVNGSRVNNWDIKELNNNQYIDKYFFSLEMLINSGLFDSVGHADSILRSGICEEEFLDRLKPLVSSMLSKEISYEVNCSGRFKSMIDTTTGLKTNNASAFPSYKVIEYLFDQGVSFTIGSDAHHPNDVGRGIVSTLQELKDIGVSSLCYYENRIKKEVVI